VLAGVGIVLIAKPLAALIIIAVLGHPVRTALTVAIGLAQIGEFSFIVSELARKHGLMPDAGHNVLVAVAILSITANPLFFRALPKIEDWLRGNPRLWKLLNGRAERRAAHPARPADLVAPPDDGKRLAIVVGYGPVGRAVHRVLNDGGLSKVVIDMNMETVSALKMEGHLAIYGDAANSEVLEQAGMKRASHVVVTLPNASHRLAVITASRAISEHVRIVVRARYLKEREELERGGASAAVFEEAEAAVALTRLVLADTGLQRNEADRKLQDIRLQFLMDNFSHLRSQGVASVMIPWSRVSSLPAEADREEILRKISRDRFSRWPVMEGKSRRPTGYLLAKDLITGTGDWHSLIRPIGSVNPDDSIDSTLLRMQEERASLYLVEDGGIVMGLITREGILEQVVGQLEDEDARDKPVRLEDAVKVGGVVQPMVAKTRDEAVHELVRTIPPTRLPAGMDFSGLAALVLEREQ
ncbi:MAG TPA: NAD-binding protein, partial [Luteolibacter sp.]